MALQPQACSYPCETQHEEEFEEKGIVECHKARLSVVLRSVILQELLAAGTLPPAPRWWYGVVQGWAAAHVCCCAKWKKSNQQKQSCSAWDNRRNGSLITTTYLSIPGWEQTEFAVLASMSWYMIYTWWMREHWAVTFPWVTERKFIKPTCLAPCCTFVMWAALGTLHAQGAMNRIQTWFKVIFF